MKDSSIERFFVWYSNYTKLYLSSYFLGNHPDELAKLVGSNRKVGIILNAADIYGNEKRPTYLANETLVYGGFSPGSYVATQTLKGIPMVESALKAKS
jgi:hypothetical protein